MVYIETLEGANKMMLLNGYTSKKSLKEAVGQSLMYTETSLFGAEFMADGTFTAAHRPAITGEKGSEFFATITMEKGLIKTVK